MIYGGYKEKMREKVIGGGGGSVYVCVCVAGGGGGGVERRMSGYSFLSLKRGRTCREGGQCVCVCVCGPGGGGSRETYEWLQFS